MQQKISKLFNGENSVRSASVILVITLALSNILGLLRDHLLARYIETSNLDVYFASFRIPDLVFNFLILGAIFSALVPVFSDYRAKNEIKEAWKIVNTVLNLAVILMIASAILIYFLMPYLVYIVVPDFPAEKIAQTVKLSRIIMLTPIFFSASYIVSGVLNSYNRFFAYSLAPLVYNLSIIAGIVILGKSKGVEGVAYFVVIGAMLHLLIQIPSVIKIGFKYQWITDYKNKAVQKIFKLMLPRTVGLGANQILLLVYTSIASYLAAGSISAFNFANNIQTVPTVVFGGSMATAIFPTLTMAISKSENDKFCFYLNKTIRTISYILIPISIIIFLLRAQIIRLVLGAGYFAWADTTATAATLGYFSLSLLPQGLIPLFARAFYATKDTKTPMYIGLVSTAMGILFAVLLTPTYSVAGLAMAFGVSSLLNAMLLYIGLQRISCYKPDKKILVSFIKILTISLIMAIVLQFSKHFIDDYVNMSTFFGVLTQSISAFIIAVLSYVLLSKLTGLEELNWVFKRGGKDV
ncbi:MAG: putative peptidoglycan biosynthesis protein MurJ [bacterium ADurb.Bin212]|nr:MAG: putative peptidoglycan biosynthesis protein MurJ [bacterium ADurb.Bin212]